MYGCKGTPKGVLIDHSFNIYIVNTQGENMLSLDTDGHLNTEMFKLYYINEKGNKALYYNSMMLSPKGYALIRNGGSRPLDDIKSNDKTFVTWSMTNQKNTDNPTLRTSLNYIEWNKKDIDTIECKYYIPTPSFYCISEVKINGDVLWTSRLGSGPSVFKKVIDGDKSTITLVTDELFW